MTKTSAAKAVIRLQTIGASVRPNCDHTGTFLDVTFKCTLAPRKEDPRGFGISFPKSEIASVEQLVECSHATIHKLLKKHQKNKQRVK